MSDIKTISRQLYTDSIRHIYTFQVIPNSQLPYVNKVWNILSVLDLYVKEADKKSAIPVKLSKDLKNVLDIHRNIFYTYILGIAPNLPPAQAVNTGNIIDDTRNQYIFNSLFNSLKSNLNSYLDIDQEFGLKNAKDSLEAMFALLIVNLNAYRGYFNLDGLTAFSNYSSVNSILSENSDQKSEFFNSPNTIDKSIAINSVNVNNPVPYASNQDWKTLFNNLYTATFSSINTNIQIFYIKNTLINSLEAILFQEKANFNSKTNFVTPFIFEGKEITENNIKKIQITSPLTSNINVSDWLNHSLIYLNASNASTKSKITNIENGNKLTLIPYASLSSSSKQFSFLTIKEGINVEKNFQSFTISSSTPKLFSLDVITGTNTLRTIDFKFENSAFRNNYISFPVATSNPLTNGWILDNQIKASNVPPNNSFKGSQVVENNINKIKIMSTLPSNVDISTWLNYGVTYFNSSNVLTKSRVTNINKDQKTLTLDPYNGISTTKDLFKFLTTPEGVNIEKDFQSFTINKSNSTLFSVEVIKDSVKINSINFKIDDSAFNTNYIEFSKATANPLNNGWGLKTKNPTSNSTLSLSFTRDPSNDNFVLNKNNINSNGSIVYYDFRIDNTDLKENFNITFDYEVLSQNFSSQFLTLELYSIENNTENFIKTLGTLNSSSKNFSDNFVADSFYINYRFKIKFNDFNDAIKISFNNFYIGKDDITETRISYSKPRKLISDLFLTPLIKNNLDVFILYSEIPTIDDNDNVIINYRLKLTSEPSHKGSRISFKITNVNTNFNWFINNGTFTGLDPLSIINQSISAANNPNVTFYRDTTNNSFILNKGNVSSRDLKLYYNFKLESFDDNNQNLKINFDYKILTPNFSPSNLTLEICYTDRGNDITLKTLNNLDSTFNTNLKFADNFDTITPITGTYSITSTVISTVTFIFCTVTARHSFSRGQSVYLRFTSGNNKPTNNYYIIDSITPTSFKVKITSGSGTGNCNYSVKTSNNYKFKITFNDFANPIRISFNNFYIGKDSISSNSITYTNPKKLINDLFLSSQFKNNRDCFFSYNQTTSVDANGVSTVSYKLKISSEPTHIGQQIKFRFHSINSNFSWFLTEETLSGLDPIKVVDTGFEKKYYDSFISLNKRIFGVINAYAFSRLLVPEIFDEEQDVFNFGANINFNIKGYFSDILDELKGDLLFKGDLLKDPRSNFLGSGEPIDTLSRSVQWKSGGVKDALGLKQFTKFKSQLEKIKSALKKVKSILDAIKAFISILEELIELGEDLLGALLDQVINQVQKVVDNIASTGVYWLPVIQYFELADTSKWWSSNISNSLLDSPIENPYPNNPDVIINSVFLKELNDLQKGNKLQFQDDLDIDASRVSGSKERKNKIIPLLPFRSTTYEEFINVIISGLLDEGDLPELGLKFNSAGETGLIKDLGFTTSGANFIRPGAPKWSNGSQSAVVLVAICLPAPEDLIAGWEGFLKSLLVLLKPIKIAIGLLFGDNLDFLDGWINKIEIYLGMEKSTSTKKYKQAYKQVGETVSEYAEEAELDTAIDDIANWWNQSTILDEAIEDRGGKFTGSRGTYPDFIGFSIGSTFPGLFSVIKGFLRKLKKLNEKESTFSLSEKLEKMIQPLTDFIDDIEDIIKAIEDIINAIDALMNINISYLVIKSNNGVADIVGQIEDATNFPNEDKRQIILGGLLGAGMISPTGNEFNFSGYMKESAAEFNEDAEELFSDLKLSNEEKGISFLNKFFGG